MSICSRRLLLMVQWFYSAASGKGQREEAGLQNGGQLDRCRRDVRATVMDFSAIN
jgi:hypothetical protein